MPAPSTREPLAKRTSLRFCQRPHLRGGCLRSRLGESSLGASGRLHGKVTGKEVADALAQLAGAPIDKKKIELETKDIKDAGVFNGKVRLHVGVVASFKIMVEVEQA